MESTYYPDDPEEDPNDPGNSPDDPGERPDDLASAIPFCDGEHQLSGRSGAGSG